MTFPVAENLLLLGDQALSARWVRFCRAKAMDFEKNITGVEMLSKRLILPDGWAIVKVAKGRRKIIIYTESGFCFYEFWTSELIEVNYLYTPPWDGDGVNFSVCGKGSYHRLGAGKTSTPLVEACTGCGDGDIDDPGEELLPYSKRNCGTEVHLDDMKTPDYWNLVKMQQYIYFPGFKGDKFVIGGHDNAPYFKQRQMLTRYNVRNDIMPGGGFGWFLISVGSQIPSAYTVDGFTPFAQGGFTPGSERIWGGCLHYPSGPSSFEIVSCVDQDNVWRFWEAGDWSAGSPPKVVTRNIGINTSLFTHGMQTIHYNNNGTKACALWNEFQLAKQDKSGNDVYKAVLGVFQGLPYGSGNVDVSYGGSKTLALDEMPALVEWDISVIEASGDWDANVSSGTLRVRFKAGQDWVLAADYLGADYIYDDNGTPVTYPAGSLVIAVMDAQYDNIKGLTIGVTPYWPDDGDVYVSSAIHIKIERLGVFETVRTMVMQQNVYTYPTPSPINDELGNPQAGWATDMVPGDDGTGDGTTKLLRSDVINAFELKTLSWVRYRFYQTTEGPTSEDTVGSSCIEVYQKNALINRTEIVNTPHPADVFSGDEPTWPFADHSALTLTEVELLTAVNATVFDPLLRGQIAWHPKGHFAVCEPLTPIPPFQVDDGNPATDDFFMVDIVKAAGKSYSHKDLYNNAFGDTRQYSFYNDNTNYRGVFMTAGLFRDA
jgi:hypothetical protein